MRARVVHGQPFGQGGVVEGLIGRNQRHRGETSVLALPADFEGGGELDGVVGAQAMRIGQPHGLVEQGGREVDEGVAPGKMAAEAVEDRRGLGGGERLAFAAAGDGRGDLDGGDAGQIGATACAAARQAAHPGGAVLLDVALDQGAGIDEVGFRHRQRRSRMMVSDNGSPLMVTG